jgi:hypothetical protein
VFGVLPVVQKVRMKEFLEVLKAAGLLRTEFGALLWRAVLPSGGNCPEYTV